MSVKTHFSSFLNEWRECTAGTRPCKYTSHADSGLLKEAKQWMKYKENPIEIKSYKEVTFENLNGFLVAKASPAFVMPTAQDKKVSADALAMHNLRSNFIASDSEKILAPILEGNYVERCKSLIGKNLTSIYRERGYRPGNKGWKGNALEYSLGLKQNSSSAPDTIDGEIKSYTLDSFGTGPTETIALSSFSPRSKKDLSIGTLFDIQKNQSFVESHLFEKIKKSIYVGIVQNQDGGAIVSSVDVIDLTADTYKAHLEKISKEWEMLITAYRKDEKVSGKLLTYLEIRTKGSKDSDTRAFYWKKQGVRKLFEVSRSE